MPTKKPGQAAPKGRQAAFVARQQEDLLALGARVLAELGMNAQIDEIVKFAKVSKTTIYRYFDTREEFLLKSFSHAFGAWQDEALSLTSGKGDLIADFVLPLRLLLHVKVTDPILAKILSHPDFNERKVFLPLSSAPVESYRTLVKAGFVENDQIESRISLFAAAYVQLVSNSVTHLTLVESEQGLSLILQILGFSKAQISKVMKMQLSVDAIQLQ